MQLDTLFSFLCTLDIIYVIIYRKYTVLVEKGIIIIIMTTAGEFYRIEALRMRRSGNACCASVNYTGAGGAGWLGTYYESNIYGHTVT